MSFLIDPPLLYASGTAYSRLPEKQARPLGVATLAVFLIASVSCYLNLPWSRVIWGPFPARDGRDFMINSGVLRFRGEPHPALAAAIFATYPLWLLLGYRRSRR